MKDRVPAYPGRVTLRPVPGQADTYDMTRADQPSEPGSALNKANLLPDDVARSLWLDPADDPQVKDALGVLAAALPQSGDIKITARTDLGEDWLLCNGDLINRADYPALYGKLPTELETAWHTAFTGTLDDNLTSAKAIRAVNGAFAVIASQYSNDNNNKLYYIAPDSLPAAAPVPVNVENTSTFDAIFDIAYGNGKYVIVGGYSNIDGHYPTVWCADAITGPWQYGNMTSTGQYSYSPAVCFGNGVFAAKRSANSGYSLMYASDPSGEWIQGVTLPLYVGLDPVFVNGYFVWSDSTRTLYCTGHPASKPSAVALPETVSSIYNVVYGNGVYVAAVQTGSYTGGIACAESLSGPWTVKQLPAMPQVLFFADGKFVAAYPGNTQTVYIAGDPEGEWTAVDIGSNIDYLNNETIGVIGSRMLCCIRSKQYVTASTEQLALPAISPDKSYAYIKAK